MNINKIRAKAINSISSVSAVDSPIKNIAWQYSDCENLVQGWYSGEADFEGTLLDNMIENYQTRFNLVAGLQSYYSDIKAMRNNYDKLSDIFDSFLNRNLLELVVSEIINISEILDAKDLSNWG